ncbi:hypothetical protein MTO98_25185 [Mucilaginibacter sp. SMC90]|uniref:hypothetical protein n=1 Tax=Mucilaginibacter sp. SMC90 TaxID=2929803 RepID=UPI001FB26D0F|nr:hypothetical protein [Mucilaginibacter sp. SMC90]UOE47709.1 hypothetical protein MTO98_25185 [Mucilaginibacter sp. SMC90]
MKQLLSFIAIIMLLQSCATVNINSNKDPNYTQKPKKIYIEIKCKKDMRPFGQGLANGLKTDFESKGVSSISQLYDDLDLESAENLEKKVSDYAPDAVFLIKQTVYGDQSTFELGLIDSKTKKFFWKSEIVTTMGTYGDFDELINKARKAILTRLTADGVL